MTVKIDRILEDLAGTSAEQKLLALSTIPRLSGKEDLDDESLGKLKEVVWGLAEDEDPDTSFLARKAQNFLQTYDPEARREEVADQTPPADADADAGPAHRTAQQLLTALRSETDSTKIATLLTGLKKLGDRSCAQSLVKFLEHGDPRVRSNAVECLEILGGAEQIPDLLPLLSDENNRVRGNVAKALGVWDVPEVAECIRKMLTSPQVSLRESGIYALTHLPRLPGIELVAPLIKDEYEGVRLRVVHYLEGINGQDSTDLLRRMVRDMHPEVREGAMEALERRGVTVDSGEGSDPELTRIALEEVEEIAGTPPPTSTPAEISPDTDEQRLDEALQRTILGVARELEKEERRAQFSRALFVAGTKGYLRVRNGDVQKEPARVAYYDVLKVQQFLKSSIQKLPEEGPDREPAVDKMMGLYREYLRLALIRMGKVMFGLARAQHITMFPELEEIARLESSSAEA